MAGVQQERLCIQQIKVSMVVPSLDLVNLISTRTWRRSSRYFTGVQRVTGAKESPHLELVKLRSSHVLVPQSQPVVVTVSVATCKVRLLRKGNCTENGPFFNFPNRFGVGHVRSFILPTPH